jgi:hypothetical protein
VPRTTLCFALLFTTVELWLNASAIAFTLRLAPMPTPTSPSALPVGGLADLPTPQCFRFVIAPHGITLALEPRRTVPAHTTARLQQADIPYRPPAAPHTSQAHPSPLPRSLSGVETRLLLQTQVVGARQRD